MPMSEMVEGVVEDEDGDILEKSREGLKLRIEDEQDQRDKMLDDLKFATLDQWPDDIRRQREGDVVNGPRPCLTIDQINQYITQVSNDMAKNRPSIKTRPVDNFADPETAKIYQGLIRHIEDQSRAGIAYQTSGDSAVTVGLGFFRIVSDYVDDVSSEQELLIKRVPDTFSVYLGPHLMPDGSDADEAWVFERMPIKQFKREFPKAKITSADFDGLGVSPTWKTDEEIIVCEYYYKKYEKVTRLFLADGSAVTQSEYEKAYGDATDAPEIIGQRSVQKVSIKWCKHTGCEILDKRDQPGKYIPVIEVVGKEKIVEGKRLLWGLVRPAKDSLRAFNYWISALTEKMALAPKAPFVGAVGQFKSTRDRWEKANQNNYAMLEYDPIDVNGNALPAPRRQEPMQMEPAMAQMLQMMQNNVKSSLGMYKAAIGDTESQQSGRAILALQKESDTGTSHFGDNQAISIAHAGRILVDLIPYYYDTKRVLRILGEDGKAGQAQIDPEQKEAMREIRDATGKIKRIYNLNVGKYDVTTSTGPSYQTNRQEAATVMSDLANTAKDPISAAILRYGAIKNSDFSGSEEITGMLKAMLPPQVQPASDGQNLPPEAVQKIAQLAQAAQGMQQKLQEVAQENQQLKSGAAIDMAKVNAQKEAAAEAHKLKVAEALDADAFDRWKAKLDAETKIAAAEIAAKADKEIALKEAEHAANVELAKTLGQPAPVGPDGAAPVTPMDTLAQMHQQTAQQHQDGMAQLAQALGGIQQVLQQILQVTVNPPPRQVSIGNVQKDAAGRIIGANIATTMTAPTIQ